MSKRIRVAVAEDIEILREDLIESLKECEKIEVVGEAATGKGIVELVSKTDVDIVLMDIEMEGKESGLEAARAIYKLKPHVRIIFLTVHDNEEMIYKAYSTSMMADYIIKTESHDLLIKKILKVYKGINNWDEKIIEQVTHEFSRLKENEANLLFFVNTAMKITPTEREVIKLLLKNMKIAEMAAEREVAEITIKTQVSGLLRKFNKKRSKEIVALLKELKLEKLFD